MDRTPRGFRRALFLGVLLAGSPSVSACPMCSDLLERGRDAAGLLRLTDGVAWSMALLLLMPALVTTGLVIYFRRHWRKKEDAPASPS